jgi:hypothetical protein
VSAIGLPKGMNRDDAYVAGVADGMAVCWRWRIYIRADVPMTNGRYGWSDIGLNDFHTPGQASAVANLYRREWPEHV